MLERIAARQADLDDILSSASSTTGDDEHDPEGATIGFERAQAQALLDKSVEQLARIDTALARHAEGTYGRCVTCGKPIARERLQALPAAERCVRCATARR